MEILTLNHLWEKIGSVFATMAQLSAGLAVSKVLLSVVRASRPSTMKASWVVVILLYKVVAVLMSLH